MSVTVHPLTAADVVVVDPMLTAAYERPASMANTLSSYLQLQPDGWFLARYDGVPVGMGGVIIYGDLARIGLVATHPDYQRRGIGRLVMEHLLRWASDRGATTVRLDASPVGAPLYSRLGFVTDDYVQVYVCPASFMGAVAATRAASAADGVAPLRLAHLPEVIAFDSERFGADFSQTSLGREWRQGEGKDRAGGVRGRSKRC